SVRTLLRLPAAPLRPSNAAKLLTARPLCKIGLPTRRTQHPTNSSLADRPDSSGAEPLPISLPAAHVCQIEHHLHRLSRDRADPAEPGARDRRGDHRAGGGSLPSRLVAAPGRGRLLLPGDRRLLHPVPRRRGRGPDRARRAAGALSPVALTILGARAVLA